VYNFTRECQSHWRKNFLPHIRFVATILCESLRHKSNTFYTILALRTIDHIYGNHYRWNKWNTVESQRLKIYVQNVHHSREHMPSNDYATVQPLPRWWCGPAASTPLAHQTFFQLLHILDLRTVDPLLKYTPDSVVHRIQIWRWPHLWRDKLLIGVSLSLCSMVIMSRARWTAWFQWRQHYVTR